jgi:hypothetical protein
MFHDQERVKFMRTAIAQGVGAVSHLQCQVKDIGVNGLLEHVQIRFNDVDSILWSLESEQRSPSQEAMLLDGVEIILRNAVEQTDNFKKLFDAYGPDVAFD